MRLFLIVAAGGLVFAFFRFCGVHGVLGLTGATGNGIGRARFVAAIALACALLMLGVTADALTPLWFMADYKPNPAGQAIVIIGELIVIVAVLWEARALGMTLAAALSLLTIVTMPFNFLAAWVGTGYSNRTDIPSLLFWFYYVLQFPMLFLSARDVSRGPRSEQGLRYSPTAVAVAAVWAVSFLVFLAMAPDY